jgi:hypothetical protein
MTKKNPYILFALTWVLIWWIGTKIWLYIYDIAAFDWHQGIKGLPLGLAIAFLIDKLLPSKFKNGRPTVRYVFWAVLLYWPCLQLILISIYL